MPDPARGEIWLVDWSPSRGSEQAGRRPALVIQTDAANLNANYPLTIVAALSSQGRAVPSHVLIQPYPRNGLKNDSYVKCEQIMTVSKDRLIDRWGSISPEDMSKVSQALRQTLSLLHES